MSDTTKESTIKRGLKARHLSMIAIGGCIGTGCRTEFEERCNKTTTHVTGGSLCPMKKNF